jgi:hypothetical protein
MMPGRVEAAAAAAADADRDALAPGADGAPAVGGAAVQSAASNIAATISQPVNSC